MVGGKAGDAGSVPGKYIGCVEAGVVHRERAGVLRKVDANGQLAQLRHGKTDRIADGDSAGGNREGFLAAELQLAVRFGLYHARFHINGDVRFPDGERGGSVSVGELDADPGAPDAGGHHHPDGLVVETGELSRWRGSRAFGSGLGRTRRSSGAGLRRGGPSGDPVLICALCEGAWKHHAGADQNRGGPAKHACFLPHPLLPTIESRC